MNIMALDLEMNQPSGSIIEIGITIGNINTGEIFEKRSWIIKIDEKIDERIISLTTITQEMVDNGYNLIDAYKEMTELYKKYSCTLNMSTWGGGDHRVLKMQIQQACQQQNITDVDWQYGHREFDVKTIFLAFALADNKKVQSGLAKSLTRAGMAFQGTKHRAVDDAYNTFRLLFKLIQALPKNFLTR